MKIYKHRLFVHELKHVPIKPINIYTIAVTEGYFPYTCKL